MLKQINLNGKEVSYVQKRSSRASNLRLAISEAEGLIATLPPGMHEEQAESFIRRKSRWVLKKLALLARLPPRVLPKISAADYKKYRFDAWELAHRRLKHFNQNYNLRYSRVSIKKQSTRWGSCSRKGNLNFNYRIVFLPPELADYLIVHELCHLKEMNHSRKFWAEVGRTILDCKHKRKMLHNLR